MAAAASGDRSPHPGAPGPVFPRGAADRDRFVLAHRPPRRRPDPSRPSGAFCERERTASGGVALVATVFLVGRECPWRCTMCDLWTHAIEVDTRPGALPRQLEGALAELRRTAGPFAQAKLFNAGSFFDPRAVPEADYPALAGALDGISHVIVESHPALIGPRVDRFVEALAASCHGTPPTLEVAMGLETAHPEALDRLNKRMTLAGFARAAAALAERGIAMRAFVLVGPPFVPAAEQDAWLARSVDFAFDCGATAVSLIPTRLGNGTLEALQGMGAFTEPTLDDLERGLASALGRARGRVFADLWDVQRFTHCAACAEARRDRLARMNLAQHVLPGESCERCGRQS